MADSKDTQYTWRLSRPVLLRCLLYCAVAFAVGFSVWISCWNSLHPSESSWPQEPKQPLSPGVRWSIMQPNSNSFWIHSLAYTPDGSMVAGVTERHGLYIWNAVDGTELRNIPVKDAITLAISPDGKYLAVPNEQSIDLWALPAVKHITSLKAPGSVFKPWSLTFSFDSRLLIADTLWKGGSDIAAWRLRNGKLLYNLAFGNGEEEFVVSISDNDRTLITTTRHKITCRRVQDGKRLGDEVVSRFSGKTIIKPDGNIVNWKGLGKIAGEGVINNNARLFCSPDRNILAEVSSAGVRLLRISDAEILTTLTAPDFSYDSVAFSPDSHSIAVYGSRGLVVWKVPETGSE